MSSGCIKEDSLKPFVKKLKSQDGHESDDTTQLEKHYPNLSSDRAWSLTYGFATPSVLSVDCFDAAVPGKPISQCGPSKFPQHRDTWYRDEKSLVWSLGDNPLHSDLERIPEGLRYSGELPLKRTWTDIRGTHQYLRLPVWFCCRPFQYWQILCSHQGCQGLCCH